MAEQTFGILEILLLGVRALGIFAAFAAFAWALLRMRREHADQLEQVLLMQRELSSQNQVLSERLTALATLVGTAPRRAEPLSEIVHPMAPPMAPPPRMHAPRRDTGMRSYETAKRMARDGASVEEIVASCGVAGTEARLLRRLHGADKLEDFPRDDAA